MKGDHWRKAFLCKSHLLIAIYSEWRPFVVYMFAMGQAIYFREERAAGGLALTEKTNHVQEKEENKFVHKEAWESIGRLYASPTYFWYLYNSHIFSPIRMKIVE